MGCRCLRRTHRTTRNNIDCVLMPIHFDLHCGCHVTSSSHCDYRNSESGLNSTSLARLMQGSDARGGLCGVWGWCRGQALRRFSLNLCIANSNLGASGRFQRQLQVPKRRICFPRYLLEHWSDCQLARAWRSSPHAITGMSGCQQPGAASDTTAQ